MFKCIQTSQLRKLLAKYLIAGSVFLCLSGNAQAALVITKAVDPTSPSPAAENAAVSYNLTVENTGTEDLNNVTIDDVPSNLNNLVFTETSANGTGNPLSGDRYRFNDLAAGETVTLDLDAMVNASDACPIINNTASVSVSPSQGGFSDSDSAAAIEYDFEFTSGTTSNVISHVTATSFCELCDTGTVHIRITNPTTAALQNITLVENLQSLGLTYVLGSTTSSIGGANNPIAPGGGPILTWTPTQIPALGNLAAGATLNITFGVSTFGEAELLANPNRNIIASATFDMACITGTQTVDSGQFELPLQEPVPQVFKRGRNVDGGQNSGNYTPIVYGQEFDDIIWRVDIRNNGLAGLQDLLIADTIGGNFVVNYICPTQTAAETTAITNNGAAPAAGCVPMDSSYAIDDPFGNPANDETNFPPTFIDVAVGGGAGRALVYYVGRINASCTDNEFNTADIQWGCEATGPDGGITTTSTGINPGPSSAELSTDNGADLTIDRVMQGIDGGPEIGSNGEVIITITNNTGGTVRDIVLDDLLPVEYVRDTTFAPVLSVNRLHSAYAGMINIITDTNEDLVTLLNNTRPVFTLTSTTARAELPDINNNNMLRAGDVATITFRIVLVDKPHFDIVADLDVFPEAPASANTDPDNAFNVRNILTVNYLDTCTFSAATPLVFDELFDADIEDLDVTTSAPLYILTNDPAFPVDLTVELRNHGGHDARNYYTYVSFGETIDVQSVPGGCSLTSNPPPRAVWIDPAPIPATAAVYECTDNNPGLGTINPGPPLGPPQVSLTFSVIKDTSAAAILADDLTFRADVVGVIELFDGTTELTVPPPDTATINNTTNNYTLDAIRTRVLGFNLTKALPPSVRGDTAPDTSACTEDSNVPVSGDSNLIIGEDCTYHIEAGGWFGFKTPGFTLIEVHDVVVTDDLDDGLGYISHDFTGTDFAGTGGVITSPIVINSPPSSIALSETDITWAFNPSGSGIKVKNQFLRVDITTRLLNDQVDASAGPNVHAAPTFDIGKASFTAVFDTDTFDVDETKGIPGYPDESVRRVDLTVTEPSLSVVKEVCNETLSATKGNVCSPFSPTINFDDPDAGDTQDEYVYRIIITNEAANAGVNRAPAYNVAITDELDSSDLMIIAPSGPAPFDGDGLDNDGDGLVDGADGDGEYLSLSENVVNAGGPASFVISHEHSDALDRIDPGESVTFFYRIDPDDTVAPRQRLRNTVVEISYDSLDGDFGNQNAPQIDNTGTGANAFGRARLYDAVDVATAYIEILPLDAQPKVITSVSNSPFPTGPVGTPQDVVIGEEILYELRTFIPVANLKDFKIRDELPPGIRCIQAQNIDLNAVPYSAARFRTNGAVNTVTFPATCDPSGASNVVEWSFGNQELTDATSNTLFEFTAWFIARVDNINANRDDDDIINGGASTVVTTSYINESDVLVTLPHDSVAIKIKEPRVELTKRFTDASGTDISNADADDIVTITVTARNTGTATAYNLQILDDLDLPADTRLTYVGNETGVVPDNIDLTTLGANRPVFNWDNPASAGYALDVNELISFTFQVQVEREAQPLEILNNTIQSSWTSLPSINTALNSTGSIGVDGAIDGMRNGRVPNVADGINNYESNAVDQVAVPDVLFSKTDLDPAILTLPIGAHKRFQIDIDFPEGTTNAVLLEDNLAFSSLSYVLENDAVFAVTYSFTGIDEINDMPANEAAFNSLPADEAPNLVAWDIGKVVTLSEDDLAASAISPRIRITYYARVNNDADTDVGDTLQNSATLSYQNGETPTTTESKTETTAPITVIEPLLTVGKVVTNETPGKADTDLPDAGDLLQYVITVTNNNPANSVAYDVNLVDTLPPDLLWYSGFTPTALINGSLVAGFGAIPPGGEPLGPLVWGRDNLIDTLDIPVNGTLVITYQTEVQNTAEANRELSNSVLVDWTSLDGVNADERTGSNAPPYNDYFTIPAVATTTVIDNNSISKASNDDSYLDTGNVRVGDTVDYTLTLRLQEGTTRTISLLDTLPNGLEFVSVLSVNGDSAAPYSSAGVFTHADINAPVVTTGPGDNTISWTLGDAITGIVNAADNNAANDDFVIVYRAQVVNDELSMPQDASTNLINNAVMDYRDSDNNVVTSNDTETIDAQQPIIFTADLSKVRRGGLVSGSPVASGEIMDFRLSACNSGDAPAYDLIVEDLLPTELDETTITTPVVTINGGATTAADYVYTPPAGPAGTMRFLFNNEAKPVNPGQCAVIDFDIRVRTPIGIDQTFKNEFQTVEYHSLDSDNPNQLERESYGPAGPVEFLMNTVIDIVVPDKSLVSPLSHEATIGEIITYQVKVPGDSDTMSVDLFDVLISDDMASNLTFVDATLDAGSTYTGAFDTSASVANQMRIGIDLLPVMTGTTQQAVFNIRARVNNDANTNALLPAPTPAFGNVVSYTFANSAGGAAIFGGSATPPPGDDISIVEPVLTVAKTVVNTTKPGLPDAGDRLTYSVTLTASGGGVVPADFFSSAFDVSIDDTLSLGLLYIDGSATVDGVITNTIIAPVTNGADGISAAQTLSWSLAQANADIDVVEGTTVTVTYDVLVLDTVLANQDLSNTVDVQWSSRDGPDVIGGTGEGERNGSNVPPYNDYFFAPQTATITTADTNTVTKTRVTDTFDTTDNEVRIGDIIEYRLLVSLQEGTHPNTEIVDSLPLGMRFEETVSINGDTFDTYANADAIPAVPYSHPDIAAPAPGAGPTTITWTVGEIVNPGDNAANDDFEIIYRARVLNLALAQTPATQPLNNLVDLIYDTATVRTTKNDIDTIINVLQPNLSVTKTRIPATDTVLDAGEVVIYRVEINNTLGTAPAYDTVLRDIIPLGMRIAGVTTTSVQLVIGGVPQPALPNLTPVFNGATGTTTWDFDTALADQYTIPAGETLRIEYEVQADAGIGAGLTLTNEAQVQVYYSFDNGAAPSLGVAVPVREIYAASNIATVSLTTDDATELLKENKDPTNLDASIGESFTYTIKVPATLQPTALYDVQILDDLNLSAADLLFVGVTKVSGLATWTPENIGTVAGELIIADVTNGIDIPPNDQAVIEVTVTLRNTAINVEPLAFNNTANYVFNAIDNSGTPSSAGIGDDTVNMRVVEPDLTLVKTGPATTVSFLAPIPYTLVVENVGEGPAFDTTIIDKLPAVPDNAPLTGGTCNATPINIVVNIFQNNGTTEAVRSTPLPLVLDTDYNVTYTAAPSCELVITTLSDKARIEATEKLIVTYATTLDVGTQSDAELTNIAGVTRWFSLDTAGAGATDEIREYTSALTSSAMVTVEAPALVFQKTVVLQNDVNLDGIVNPGDTLRYSIFIENTGPVALPDFSLIDEVDGLAPTSGFFASGTMANIVIPLTADGSNTDIAGGANGAGLLDVRNLSIDEAGGTNPTVLIEFDITLLPVIDSNTIVLNQAQIDSPSTGILLSDYPVTPAVADPTPTTITSAPDFLVEKTSSDITGDPAILLPGDTLRYTLTVKNIGFENAVNTLLSDQIPANTAYVANSTMLNGVVVADPAAGISALAAGMPINAPENTTAGFLRADIDVAANNVATITFDVVVNLSAVNGTVISNQGFFSGEGVGSGAFPQQPSDDPDTAAVDDPTLDVVGNVPVIDVLKTVVIQTDLNSNGIVDPDDTLRYTITSTNIGAIPATGVVLTDAVPVNSTYVGNSSTLNGNALSDPGVNVSPFITGVDISSSDLPPPTAGNGTLTAGESAIVTFDVLVNSAATPGTIISNQGFVSSNEAPEEPSDADGNDANGDQPTVVVVGNVQQLSITKQVLVVGGGAAQAGGQLEYIVRVTNIGSVAAENVVITDDLDFPVAGQMTYVAGSGLLNGLPAGVSDAGLIVVTADYAATYGDLPVAGFAELRFRVLLDAALNIGDTVSNTGEVEWDVTIPTRTATAEVSIDIGGTPGAGSLNGQVWHDADFSNDVGGNEALLQGWRVELYRNSVLLGTALTDVAGNFQFSGLAPNLPADGGYELRYFAPGAGANTASMGTANSIFTDGPQQITEIFVTSGASLQNLNLPRQANGVVYDSILREPVAGVRLTMINQTSSNQILSENCFADTKHQNQVTLADGYYKFDLIFGDPSCNVNDEYVIQVLPPATGYIGTTSVIIPPVESVTGSAKNVPGCLSDGSDKIPATASHCENSDSDAQAATSIAPRTSGTDYYLKFNFDNAFSTNQIYNNHIPIDSELDAAVAISKVAGLLNVTRSQLVPYTITFTNTLGVQLFDLSIVDNFPAGFKYVAGSARVDDEEVEPLVNGRQLTWSDLSAGVNDKRVIKLLLIVGSGVGEGEYVNTAQAINSFTNDTVSGVASATVRVIPDPTFDCSDIIGKVYDDANMNMYQDDGEKGIAGAQVATARGLRVTTDVHGRFHITCAVVPDEVRGSNFIIKLDERTLPSGYRITTENPRVQRATRGKMLKFNFGAAIHRIVRLDLADGVFEKDSTELRPQWRSRIDMLIIELQKDPSILRLSYLGENETESEADDRLDAIEDLISERWEELNCCYKLTIEKEVFWRKGNPSDRKTFD